MASWSWEQMSLLARSLSFNRIIMLTAELLQAMSPGEIFSCGTFKDDHIGINFMGSGLLLRWVACRGLGYHDWAIYVGSLSDTESYIKQHGDKIGSMFLVARLVEFDAEAGKLYRH